MYSRLLGSCSWEGKEGEPSLGWGCAGDVGPAVVAGAVSSVGESCRHKMPMKVGQSSGDHFPPQRQG